MLMNFQRSVQIMFTVSNLYGLNGQSVSHQLETNSLKQRRNGGEPTMKYHTLSTSSIAAEGKKSNFTIYADIMDLKQEKLEAELLSTRRELEGVQIALHQQTERCRQLVTEFSKKLQSKEFQLKTEKKIRDQQLTRLLHALLLFEARLLKEQKLIKQQLEEKDAIIQFQQLQLSKCSHCSESSEMYSEKDSDSDSKNSIDYGIKTLKEDVTDEVYSSSDSTNYTAVHGSYEPNGTFTCSDDFKFESNDGEWYASASDPDDDHQTDLYKNNPVLECMNQILLQNSQSPPSKSPVLKPKTSKKVKFSDDYYEQPIQNVPNVYEVPQSMYSNDYELIDKKSDYYVDMEQIPKKVPPPLPPKPANLIPKFEPDYCSISELNQSSLYDQIITNASTIVTTAQLTPIKVPVEPKSTPDPDIPKLPQVTEICIPDTTQDNYIKTKLKTPIVMGRSVSSLITGFNNHHIMAELKFPNFESKQNKDKPSALGVKKVEIPEFDLSQNFEEFKLDDDLGEVDEDEKLPNNVAVVPPNNSKKKVVEDEQNYEQFLECTGLSSKSILTPSRLLSNHKSMLKPKDVKLRSKVGKTTTVQTNTIRYYSEPYL